MLLFFIVIIISKKNISYYLYLEDFTYDHIFFKISLIHFIQKTSIFSILFDFYSYAKWSFINYHWFPLNLKKSKYLNGSQRIPLYRYAPQSQVKSVFKYFVTWQFQSFKKFTNFIILAFKIQNLIIISAIIITFDKDQVKMIVS